MLVNASIAQYRAHDVLGLCLCLILHSCCQKALILSYTQTLISISCATYLALRQLRDHSHTKLHTHSASFHVVLLRNNWILSSYQWRPFLFSTLSEFWALTTCRETFWCSLCGSFIRPPHPLLSTLIRSGCRLGHQMHPTLCPTSMLVIPLTCNASILTPTSSSSTEVFTSASPLPSIFSQRFC